MADTDSSTAVTQEMAAVSDTEPSPAPVTVISDLLFPDRVVDAARPMAGHFYPDPIAAQFLFPADRPAWRMQAEHDLWSCELFAFRCWLAAGAESPYAALPYEPHMGAVAAWLPALGDHYGCRDTSPTDPPEPGDIVLMSHSGSPHASVITDVDAATNVTSAVDGGQIDPSQRGTVKGIRVRRRVYSLSAGKLVCHDADTPTLGPAVPVLWVMKASKVQLP